MRINCQSSFLPQFPLKFAIVVRIVAVMERGPWEN